MDVQLVMLRALAGMGARTQEVPLRVGDVLGARVLRGGALLLAGVRLQATLPPGLEPGSLVRVKVRELGEQRLVLQLVDAPAEPDAAAPAAQAAPAQVQQTVAVPLPGGAVARLFIEPDAGGQGSSKSSPRARATVTLRYESAGMGRVDLALTTEDTAVRAVIHAPAGEVAERLRSASGDLRTALSGKLARPAAVDIIAHAEVLDVSA